MNADELLQHGAFLRGLATSLLRNEQDADDVVQQAYLVALQHRPRRPRAWLGKVVRNLALRSHRGRARVARRERAAARPEAVAGAADDIERLEIQRKIVDAVLELAEPYRSVIVRRYLDELSTHEIARRSGVAYETVRTRLGRALRKLRRRLDAQDAGWAPALAPLLLRPPRLDILGGVLMSAKKTTVFVSLALFGVGVGVAGHAAFTGSAGARGARAPGNGRGGSLAAEVGRLRAEVASLRREVEGVRSGSGEAGGAGAAPAGDRGSLAKDRALANLLGIRQGERQLAIRKALEELAELGDQVVPDVVALLKAGRDHDYGGGFSLAGNVVRGYPRLRTVLIDVLRQIGTPAAQSGVLEALDGSKDLSDYRDLLMLYRTTNEEIMVQGISGMMPDLLREVTRRGGEDAGFLVMDSATRWIRKRELRDTTDLLEEVARVNLIAGRVNRGAFGVLVEFSPERAAHLVQQLHEKNAARGAGRLGGSLRHGGDAILAPIARFGELVISRLDVNEGDRGSFYMALPTSLCRRIKSSEARAADGKVMLEFLSKRLREETGSFARAVLTDMVSRLEKAIEKCEGH